MSYLSWFLREASRLIVMAMAGTVFPDQCYWPVVLRAWYVLYLSWFLVVLVWRCFAGLVCFCKVVLLSLCLFCSESAVFLFVVLSLTAVVV